MKRVKDSTGVIHFKGHLEFETLCGCGSVDLLGHPIGLDDTSEPVTCPACARLYCQIKNAPWNALESRTLDDAIYTAVGAEPPTRNGEEDE